MCLSTENCFLTWDHVSFFILRNSFSKQISFCLFVFCVCFFFWKNFRASSSHRKCAVPDIQLQILHMFHAAQSLMFDIMNMLPFQGHTSCVCLCEKQSDQIILLHANPTALRQGWLLPTQPLNFHPKQMCVLFFFNCITLVTQYEPFSPRPGFRWPWIESLLKALPTPLILDDTCGIVDALTQIFSVWVFQSWTNDVSTSYASAGELLTGAHCKWGYLIYNILVRSAEMDNFMLQPYREVSMHVVIVHTIYSLARTFRPSKV